MSLIRKLSCNVWRAVKDSRNFFVIEKQSSEEEMQPIKTIFCVCVFVFATCKEYESFVPLAHKLQKRKAIPLFLFSVGCISWYWVGRLDWKKKKLKKSQDVLE